MNETDYARAIPPWCGYQTMEGHMNMMLCWSLVGFVERGEQCPYENCKNCDLSNKDYARSVGEKHGRGVE